MVLPLPQGQIWVTEEGQLLLQTAHTEGQVARRQDEEDDTEDRGGDARMSCYQQDHYEILESAVDVEQDSCNAFPRTLGGNV